MEDTDIASPPPHAEDPDLQAAMELPITVSLGPMGPLLRKLHSIGPERCPPDEIRPLMELFISLKDLSDDEASFTSWWWKIVRELCYDMEDHLDEFVGAGADLDFSELLARAKDASERRQRFQWSPLKTIKQADRGGAGVSRLASESSPWLSVPIYGRSKAAVVEPPNRVVELLALDGDDEQSLKVIPITGCAGVGKTTVARTLFHNHGGKFQCRAFVIVSRNPDMRAFLTNMISQLKAPLPVGFPDVPDLIDAVNKHLQGKRYFIVVDDLWTASVWDVISGAFPSGDRSSRVITTTQIDDVAQSCCRHEQDCIYKMEPLNDHESRKLFVNRVFGSEDGCPTDVKEASYEIIKECGGLPLVIVNMASLFGSESNLVMEKWKHIQDFLSSTSEGIKDVLNLMYKSLPPRLKTCLLYLSMYQLGYEIKKDELVKHWVAEGFLSANGGRDTEQIAEDYIDELISRGMVQAVDTDHNGKVLSCSVHQIVLDFLRHRSREENFIITVDYFQSTLSLPDKVRRLSVQFGGVKSAYIPENIVTSHVRSFIFWGYFKCVPCITDYGLLRVLILHIWADRDKKSFDLTTIGKLFQLKYLKIECNITVKLPSKIRRLQHLGTLQIDARLSAVPSDIVNLKRLLHLRLPGESILPHVVGQLTSLRTLGYFNISSHSEENVLVLGRLTNLQDLQLICSTVQQPEDLERNVQLLCLNLEKFRLLESITLIPDASGSSGVNIPEDCFSMASPPPDLLLHRMELSRRCCIFFSLPKWFGMLKKLSILKIGIRSLLLNDIEMLKGLPALTALTLYIQTVSEEKIVIDKGGFQVLTYFKFMCAAPCLSFAQGAMPKVQRLKIGFNSNKMKQNSFWLSGFSYLRDLTEVSVKLGVEDAHNFDIRGVESALEAAVEYHTNSPIIIVQLIDVIFEGEEEESMETEGREENIQGIRDAKKKEDIPAADFLPQIQFHDSSMAKIDTYKNPSGTLDVLTFLLYSQLFSGDRPMRRNSLVRRWLAEGFVLSLDPQSVRGAPSRELFSNLNNLIEPIWPPDLSRLWTLNHLETLDFSGRQTVTVYKEVLMLPELKHLFGRLQLSKEDTPFVPVKGVVESDLEKFLREKSELQTLVGFVTGETLGFPQLMSIMRRLRKVKIWCESNASKRNLKDLSNAITEFIRKTTREPHFHRSLSIHFEGSSGEFTKKTVSVAGILDSLELRGELSQFPPFVAGLSAIEELCFWSTGLSWEVIRDGLSSVRGLKYLKLIEDNLGSLDILSEAEHLKAIERIYVVCTGTLEVAIAARPLPNLVSLHILCQDLHGIPDNPIIEITCMVKLQEVALHHQVEDTIKDELLRTAAGHPNKPDVLFLEYP